MEENWIKAASSQQFQNLGSVAVMENSRAPPESFGAESDSKLPYFKTTSFESQPSWNGELGFGGSDRRFAFARQSSFNQSSEPHTPIPFARQSSFHQSAEPHTPISIISNDSDKASYKAGNVSSEKFSFLLLVVSAIRFIRYGNRPMKRLFMMISLNVAYSTAELFIGLFSGRVGLVSDAFHLTFGCGLLTFSLFAMAASQKRSDGVFTYGYKRLEVLSAFTNALFLLFMSFSLAVEALHAFIQDESEHKHYLIISAVTNLLVNLLGVWFFRNYARINLDSIRRYDSLSVGGEGVQMKPKRLTWLSAGLVLASWLLTLGVKNAEVLCLGLVSATVFILVMPLFRTTGGILLQMAPPKIPSSALSKCWRQICNLEDVLEVSQARFWELVPGHVVGSLSLQVKKGADDHPILRYVHGLYHDLGVQDLTVQTDYV